MRARRCYKTPITPKMSSHKRNAIIISDEENTSEYSHSPSSQHSTLESNPDMPEALQKMKTAANTHIVGNTATRTTATTTTTTTDSDSSETSEADSGEDEDESYDLPTVSSSSVMQRQQSYTKKKSTHSQLVRDSNNASFKHKNLANTTNHRNNTSDIISITTYEKNGAINMV